ncbi:small ribosomal subunit protein uS3m-like [Convolutriloba macropyga]|uniref:small ribosomal subunit protein uS3m-like n=1 Tax=Convolutriloba macropyga TaxID=536237 RepID=UPI003F51E529
MQMNSQFLCVCHRKLFSTILKCADRAQLTTQRNLQLSSVLRSNTAERISRSKTDKPVTYEQFYGAPHYIGVYKGLNSHNTSNVDGFYDNAAQVNTEDYLIRKFLHGTFLNMIAMDHVIIKRKHNTINIIMLCWMSNLPVRFYFLRAYSQKILEYLFKQNVKIDIQCTKHKQIFKFI